MAGRFTIQRYPTALLNILGMQSSGDTPTELAPALVSTVETGDFYLRDGWTGALSNPLNVSAVGFTAVSGSVVVPAGEQWLVPFISIQTSGQAAATSGRYRMAVLFQSTASLAGAIQLGDEMSLAAGESGMIGYEFKSPKLWRQGDTIGLWTMAYTGAAVTQFVASVIFNRLKL